MFEKNHLFEARTQGYLTYRVPGIVCTPGGVVLATVEARRGEGGDWDNNDVLLRRSLDGGITWEAPRALVRSADYGPGPANNFVMVADERRGLVHAVYTHNSARAFAVRSRDDGATFSSPVEITATVERFREHYPWRVLATGPGHGIQLDNGRLLIPLWMSDGSGTEFGAGKLGHRPSVVASIYSDDHGQSWQCGEIVVAHGAAIHNPSETVAAQLSDGRVLFNIRSESPENRRVIAISPDGAHEWSEPEFHPDLWEPVCMASLLRLSSRASSGIPELLFANPNTLDNELIAPGGSLAHDRKRLTLQVSPDDGRTWPLAKVLEPGPSGYSDLAQMPDGTILCIYEDGMVGRITDPRWITVARFDRAWLETA